MKKVVPLSVLLALIMLALVPTVLAQQVRFEVPLTISDDTTTATLHFGIIPDAVFGLRFGAGLPTDSINGHEEIEFPPLPPDGVFDARFVWPRNPPNPDPPAGFGQGSPNDYRPFTILAQRDTFRVRSQLGAGIRLVASWPAGLNAFFTGLEMRHFDGSGLVVTDMLTNTTADITNFSSTSSTATIYSGGLVLSVEQISAGVPERFALSQNYPNPFNPSTKLDFDIQRAAVTDIAVYDILGQKVATLASTTMTPGSYTVTWDGKNTVGGDVSSGVYFVRMSAQTESGVTFSAMRKVLLVR